MKTTMLVVVGLGALTLLACGCGKSKALLAAEEYEKDACACKDAPCAVEVSKKFAAKSADMASASGGEAEAIAKATTNATTCITKVSMPKIPAMPGMPAMPKP